MTRRAAVVIVLIGLAFTDSAAAFPPYRSTDADTAAPWTLEGRLGLLQFRLQDEVQTYSTPMVRLNVGFPHHLEILSEFEFRPVDNEVGEAAVGFKWIPLWAGQFSVGFEALLLLPIDAEGGAGIEDALLASVWLDPVRLHVNVAGFYDGRTTTGESGWKAGAIVEYQLGYFRPGAEISVKHVVGEDVTVLAGPGLIVSLGPVDLRTGIRFGLAPVWPLLETSFWLTGKLPFG